jgi:hypothetical protein
VFLAVTTAPPVHEIDSFLLRLVAAPSSSSSSPSSGGGRSGNSSSSPPPLSSSSSSAGAAFSLFAALVAGGGAVRKLGVGGGGGQVAAAIEPEFARTPLPVLVPQRTAAVALPALARVAELGKQRQGAIAATRAENRKVVGAVVKVVLGGWGCACG